MRRKQNSANVSVDTEEETNLDPPTMQMPPDEPNLVDQWISNEEEKPIARRKEPRQCTKYPIDMYVSFGKLDYNFKCFISSLENSEYS